jgi:DNA repair protein RadC
MAAAKKNTRHAPIPPLGYEVHQDQTGRWWLLDCGQHEVDGSWVACYDSREEAEAAGGELKGGGWSSLPPGATPLHALDDRALIADLLGSASARRLAHLSVDQILDADRDQLARLGIASAASRRLLAAAELARRFQPAAPVAAPALERPQHFLPHLVHLRAAPVEFLAVLTLDARLGLLGGPATVAGGGLMHVAVSPREVFAPAVERRAAAIVLAHNHPSGDPSPSREDIAFTHKMARAGTLLGIQLLDHLVLTRRAYFSFAEGRLLGPLSP